MQQLFRPSRLAMLVALAAAPAWAQAAYPAYKSGTAYKAGDIVSNVGALYECKEFPYSGWCGASPYHYEPGVGVVWADAWKPYGGEEPPPALGVAVSSPAAGASFNEGTSVALGGDLERPGDGAGLKWNTLSTASWWPRPAPRPGVPAGAPPEWEAIPSRLARWDKDGKVLSEADSSFNVAAVVAPEAPKVSISSPASGAKVDAGSQCGGERQRHRCQQRCGQSRALCRRQEGGRRYHCPLAGELDTGCQRECRPQAGGH